ncbi:MAG: hypothetical protein ACQEQ0_12970, partial [Bacteroidota bacterium]
NSSAGKPFWQHAQQVFASKRQSRTDQLTNQLHLPKFQCTKQHIAIQTSEPHHSRAAKSETTLKKTQPKTIPNQIFSHI